MISIVNHFKLELILIYDLLLMLHTVWQRAQRSSGLFHGAAAPGGGQRYRSIALYTLLLLVCTARCEDGLDFASA